MKKGILYTSLIDEEIKVRRKLLFIIGLLLALATLFSCENPSGGTPQIESFSILGDE